MFGHSQKRDSGYAKDTEDVKAIQKRKTTEKIYGCNKVGCVECWCDRRGC